MARTKNDPAERKGLDALSVFVNNLADSIDPDSDRGSLIWKPNEGPQTLAYELLADETFYGGSAGGGKVLEGSEEVLSPFGWRKVKDVKVGDALVAADGTATKVLAVYPNIDHDFYKITFIDGSEIHAGAEHLWMHWYASKKIKADRKYILYDPVKGVHTESVRGRMGLTRDLYEYHKKQKENEASGKRPYWIIIPLCEPVQFTRPSQTRQGKVIRIDPYILGLLIGDGTITGKSQLAVTTVDQFIVDEVRSRYENDVVYDDKKSLRINGVSRKEIEKQLDSYGLLGKTSINKFIPEQYLFADINVRFELMSALVDTDGYIDDRGHISYTTISEQLAKDVQHLARSLGAKATLTKGKASYKDDEGNIIECNDAYTIYMMGKFKHMKRFAKLPRKRNRIKPFNGGVSEIGRRIVDIEYVGKRDGFCFAIDHPKGLHVAKDFIVTHNSDLLLGWALTRAMRSIIYRREYPQLKAIIDRSKSLLKSTGARYNGQDYVWTNIPGNRRLEFGSVPHEESVTKYMGRPYDFIGFDEISNFLYSQYIFLTTWNRTEIPGVKTRIIGAGNPPTNIEGEWVIQRWAPWLDPQYSNPAMPGELRWFVTLDEKEEEVESGTPIKHPKSGEIFYPTSRTFIPASLDNNPYYGQEYKGRLQALPPELRDKFLHGNFGLVFEEHPWQVIPNDFIKIGQERWEKLKDENKLEELTNVNPAYGYDVAEAGEDAAALCKMNVNVVQYIKYNDIADLMEQANWIAAYMVGQKSAPLGVDANGVGAGVYFRMKQLEYRVTGLKTQSKISFRDRTGNMQFNNLRSYLWWLIRDALDPYGTIQLAIPPDKKLERELMSPRWRLTENGLVQIDSKDVLRERLGRSTDAADALMLALYVSHVRRPEMRMI